MLQYGSGKVGSVRQKKRRPTPFSHLAVLFIYEVNPTFLQNQKLTSVIQYMDNPLPPILVSELLTLIHIPVGPSKIYRQSAGFTER